MILNSQPKQLTLNSDGLILWQTDPSNPLPGAPVAQIRKGASPLQPDVAMLDSLPLSDEDRAAATGVIKGWLEQHIKTVLSVLVGLTAEEGIAGPAKDIAQKVYDALGILPRSEIEKEIAGLDADMRKVLRARHVRLGPVLVFVPELNKPAAVRLRALLWWLWHDRTLPAPTPKDGVVSMIVDETQIDPVYQRAIGYPVYGGRAIRVDMLDRLISEIYDNAKDGVFKANHKMAEWMGCSIPDLYKILESMGHKKISDPAEQTAANANIAGDINVAVSEPPATPNPVSPPAPAEAPQQTPQETPSAPSSDPGEIPAATPGEVPATTPQEAPAGETGAAKAAALIKPELATFKLRRGRAGGDAPRDRGPRPSPKPELLDRPSKYAEKAPYDPNKPRFSRDKDKDKRDRPAFKGRPKGDRGERPERKQMSFEALPSQVEDSPFAILQQLKAGMKDQ